MFIYCVCVHTYACARALVNKVTRFGLTELYETFVYRLHFSFHFSLRSIDSSILAPPNLITPPPFQPPTCPTYAHTPHPQLLLQSSHFFSVYFLFLFLSHSAQPFTWFSLLISIIFIHSLCLIVLNPLLLFFLPSLHSSLKLSFFLRHSLFLLSQQPA